MIIHRVVPLESTESVATANLRYEATLRNLDTSLKRLQTDYVDLWLIHWPGPAYSTMNRRKDLIEEHGIEYYFKVRTKAEVQGLSYRVSHPIIHRDFLAKF